MSVSVILFVFSLMVLVLLFFCVLKVRRPPSPLLKKLTAAGVKLGGVEHLMARGEFWVRQEQLMTDREVHFMQGLFRMMDMKRWYLCPQVRVADIVEISPCVRKRSRAWWTLFNMAAQWHCDVVIVDRMSFKVAAAVELDDASHLQTRRQRRDILLEEVLRQAGIPLLRSRDSQALQRMICEFLSALHKENNPPHPTIRGEV